MEAVSVLIEDHIVACQEGTRVTLEVQRVPVASIRRLPADVVEHAAVHLDVVLLRIVVKAGADVVHDDVDVLVVRPAIHHAVGSVVVIDHGRGAGWGGIGEFEAPNDHVRAQDDEIIRRGVHAIDNGALARIGAHHHGRRCAAAHGAPEGRVVRPAAHPDRIAGMHATRCAVQRRRQVPGCAQTAARRTQAVRGHKEAGRGLRLWTRRWWRNS